LPLVDRDARGEKHWEDLKMFKVITKATGWEQQNQVGSLIELNVSMLNYHAVFED
jgi:hypothetical protein